MKPKEAPKDWDNKIKAYNDGGQLTKEDLTLIMDEGVIKESVLSKVGKSATNKNEFKNLEEKMKMIIGFKEKNKTQTFYVKTERGINYLNVSLKQIERAYKALEH